MTIIASSSLFSNSPSARQNSFKKRATIKFGDDCCGGGGGNTSAEASANTSSSAESKPIANSADKVKSLSDRVKEVKSSQKSSYIDHASTVFSKVWPGKASGKTALKDAVAQLSLGTMMIAASILVQKGAQHYWSRSDFLRALNEAKELLKQERKIKRSYWGEDAFLDTAKLLFATTVLEGTRTGFGWLAKGSRASQPEIHLHLPDGTTVPPKKSCCE